MYFAYLPGRNPCRDRHNRASCFAAVSVSRQLRHTFTAVLAVSSNMSTISRTAPLPPASSVTIWQTVRTERRASAGQALRPTILSAGKSLISSPMKQISSRRTPCRSENARNALALSLQSLCTSSMPSFEARRSIRGLFSPDIRAINMPDFRASDKPMMSAKWKRFHSWPSGPHHTPPSVSTPSTSMAMPLILGRCSVHPTQCLDDRLLTLEHALDPVAHGFLDQANISNQSRDSVGFEGG